MDFPYHQCPAGAGDPIFESVKLLFESQDFTYWTRLANEVDACLTPVLTLAEALDTPLPKERGLMGTARFQDHLLQVVHAIAGKGRTETTLSVREQEPVDVLRKWLHGEATV